MLFTAYEKEVIAYRKALASGTEQECILHLSRAHILSQRYIFLHLKTHFLMLNYAILHFDLRESLGQLLRIVVTVPGHLLGKVPVGNTGWSKVGLTQKMPVPPDLTKILERDF